MFTLAASRPVDHKVGNEEINFSLCHTLREPFGRLASMDDYPASNKRSGASKHGLTPESIHGISRYGGEVIVGDSLSRDSETHRHRRLIRLRLLS
jgi:hypothetical protein